MTEKKEKQITILTIILGLLTLIFIVVASTATVFVALIDPTPTKATFKVVSTVVIQKGGGPGTPSSTTDLTYEANRESLWATYKSRRPRSSIPTPEPLHIRAKKQLKSFDSWGTTLGTILVLMLITSLMLYTRLSESGEG